MEKVSQNPLASFFRQPKIFISLPSKGQFYPPGAIEIPESGEIPIYAMTARDELMFKTPDALLNGTSTIEVIKSCIPAIKNPWKVPSIDLDAILCAIRIATYGTNMDMTSQCPECGHINDLTLDLRRVLDNLREIKFSTEIIVNDSILIKLRPLTYEQITQTSLKAFEHQRIFNIVNDEKISEEEKLRLFQESFVKLTDLTIDAITECIQSIETSAGATDEKAFIAEFLRNTDKSIFEQINKTIEDSKKTATMPELDTKCSECNHEYKVSITLDQSDFFAKGF